MADGGYSSDAVVSSGCDCSGGAVVTDGAIMGETIMDGGTMNGTVLEGAPIMGDTGPMGEPATEMPPSTAPVPAQPQPSTPSTQPAVPTQPPAEDSLFGEDPGMPEEGAAEPAEGPAPQEPAEEPAAEDLFPPEEEAPPPAEESGDELDDLFGQAAEAPTWSVSIKNQPWRQWTDNTGAYGTRGQLVLIKRGAVRLLKENGRHCTVPLARLSRSDLSHVLTVAKRVLADDAVRIAER
jgi:hypothetical protein